MTDYTISSPNGGTWTIQSQNSATVGRYHDLAFLSEGASGSGNVFKQARPGILVGPAAASASNVPGAFAVAPTSGLGFSIQPGSGIVERSTLVGSYTVESTAVGTGAVGTADPSQTRVDRVDLQVLDGILGDNGGVSKTSVKVTPGTPGSGTPAAPVNSTQVGIWTIPATTVTLTTGMWTATRKSAGLRGATRVLLEGDALSDPGFMVGEKRLRVNATYGWLEDAWDAANAVWRGVRTLAGQAGVWQNGTSNIAISNSARTNLVVVSIPDPGYPYTVQASGQIDWNQYGTFTAGAPPYVQAFATIDTNAGTLLAQSLAWAGDASNTFDAITPLPMSPRSASLTGAHSVVLSGLGKVAVNCPYTGFTAGATYLTVLVTPA